LFQESDKQVQGIIISILSKVRKINGQEIKIFDYQATNLESQATTGGAGINS
jgi:hypothetical protein